MSVVILFTLFVSVFFYFILLLHLVLSFLLCCCSKSYCLSGVFYLCFFSSPQHLVYHIENLLFAYFFLFIRIWSVIHIQEAKHTVLLLCCAFSLPYVRKNHTYITLCYITTWWSGGAYIYTLYMCLYDSSSCYSIQIHTTSMPSQFNG